MEGGVTQTEAISLATILAESGEVLVEGVKLIWNLATGNLMLTFILGTTLVGYGFTMFRKGKKVVK